MTIIFSAIYLCQGVVTISGTSGIVTPLVKHVKLISVAVTVYWYQTLTTISGTSAKSFRQQ